MQLGFVHDSRYCTGCKACQVACKDKHDSEVGENFRRVTDVESGGFIKRGAAYVSSVVTYSVSIGCNHCAEPKCAANCPSGAMRKDGDTGIVSVDQSVCVGCGYCAWSCPYGAPQMLVKRGVMGKCDFCGDLLAKGEDPVCVTACPLRLLHYGEIDKLREAFGRGQSPDVMPDEKLTKPSLVILPHEGAV